MSPAPAGADPSGTPQAPGRSANLNAVLVEGRALIALIVIIAIFAILSDNYLTTGNLTTITKQVAFNAIVAIGMLLVILNGGIDLSVGSTVGLSGAVAGNLFRGVPLPFSDHIMFPEMWVIVVISVGVGMLVGLANGLLIAKLNLAPFIVTLGMLYVARGLTQVFLDGQNITNELSGQPQLGNTGFFDVFASRPLGLPISAWVMILFAVIFSIVLNRTPFGRCCMPPAATSARPSCRASPSSGCRSASTCSRDCAPGWWACCRSPTSVPPLQTWASSTS